jgi:hypothetical protein
VAAALGDLAPIDVRAEGDLGGAHGFVVAQAALEALGELAREVHGADGFEVTRFEGPPSPAELAAELARAQAWYAAHRGR